MLSLFDHSLFWQSQSQIQGGIKAPSFLLGSHRKCHDSRQDACSTVCVTHGFGSALPQIVSKASEYSHHDAPCNKGSRPKDATITAAAEQPARVGPAPPPRPFESLILGEWQRHLSFGLVVSRLVYLLLYLSGSHPLLSFTVQGSKTARRLHASSCCTLPQTGGHGIRSGKLELSSTWFAKYHGSV